MQLVPHARALTCCKIYVQVWCRLLSFAKIYLTGTNYFWMFCEGYHLHRLISNAFEAPSSTVALYLIGWGKSLLIFSVKMSV
jgi:7 transmembrane receptor (Secretin family)